MPKLKLNQIIAIEKAAKNRINDEITKLYHACQKPALMSGISRTYAPKAEDGDQLPSEATKVQARSNEMISETARLLTDLFDMTLTKDFANTLAKADVALPDGTVLLRDVPVSHLLFLEKQLVDLATIVRKIPALDPAEDWRWDSAANCHATVPKQTIKTKKVPRNHVKAEATKEHPAQVEIFHEDIVVGTWTTVNFSGAIPGDRHATLLRRIEILSAAVKTAREEANLAEVKDQQEGKKIFDWLFA